MLFGVSLVRDQFMADAEIIRKLYGNGVVVDVCNVVHQLNGVQACVEALCSFINTTQITRLVLVYKHGIFENMTFSDIAFEMATSLSRRVNGKVNVLSVTAVDPDMRKCLAHMRGGYRGPDQARIEDLCSRYGSNVFELMKARDDFVLMCLDMAWLSFDRFTKVELEFMTTQFPVPMNIDASIGPSISAIMQVHVEHTVVGGDGNAMICYTKQFDLCDPNSYNVQIPLQPMWPAPGQVSMPLRPSRLDQDEVRTLQRCSEIVRAQFSDVIRQW